MSHARRLSTSEEGIAAIQAQIVTCVEYRELLRQLENSPLNFCATFKHDVRVAFSVEFNKLGHLDSIVAEQLSRSESASEK